MKTRVEPLRRTSQRRSAAEQPARRAGAAGGPAHAREALQGERIASAFGGMPAAQRMGEEDELQMKPVVQRQAEDEEMLQGRFDTAQRQSPEEEELLQGRFATAQRQGLEEEEPLQGRMASGAPAAQREAAPAAGAGGGGGGGGLPAGLRAGMESLSGMDLADVQVHTGSSKPAEINALAYTQGNDIHVAPGQEQHLPHEAWHVVQQRQGRVQPTMELGGVNINDDAGLEAEADRMGEQAKQAGGG